jgi:type II secretory pathway pseudopilin PulG
MTIRAQLGFSYFLVMFFVAVLSVVALRAQQVTLTNERRAKEEQLMEAGTAYRDAIRSYYLGGQGGDYSYPEKLSALLNDSRNTTRQRHLRKENRDPMTARAFELIVVDGTIRGVRSSSLQRPVKRGGFPEWMAGAATAENYAGWQFVYEGSKEIKP